MERRLTHRRVASAVDIAEALAQVRRATDQERYPETVDLLRRFEQGLLRAHRLRDEVRLFAVGLGELLQELEGRRRDVGQ